MCWMDVQSKLGVDSPQYRASVWSDVNVETMSAENTYLDSFNSRCSRPVKCKMGVGSAMEHRFSTRVFNVVKLLGRAVSDIPLEVKSIKESWFKELKCSVETP